MARAYFGAAAAAMMIAASHVDLVAARRELVERYVLPVLACDVVAIPRRCLRCRSRHILTGLTCGRDLSDSEPAPEKEKWAREAKS